MSSAVDAWAEAAAKRQRIADIKREIEQTRAEAHKRVNQLLDEMLQLMRES